MKIPKKFQLVGHEIKVEFVDDLYSRRGVVGQARYNENTLLIQSSIPGHVRGISDLEQTYWHEAVHYILVTMGQDKINANDAFVDLFASLLHQILKTSEYEK